MHSHRRDDGLAGEAIPAISILTGELPRCGRGRAAGDRVFRRIAELIRDVEVERLALKPDAKAEKIPVQIRRKRAVIFIRHRVFVVNVAAAHMPAIIEITGRPELIHPASLPV